MAKILITGGSGLVGKAISGLLIKSGHEPRWLGREAGASNGIEKFKWDLSKHYMDPNAFEGVECVIHLAGAGITDKRWSEAYKKEIIDSRVKSSELMFGCISKNNYPVKTLVGASAVGYYGARQSSRVFTEEDAPGSDFLAHCCMLWENSYEPFIASGIRTTILRTGVALSKNGGAYPRLTPLFKFGLGSALGSGRQYFPWIHIHDLAAMYVKAALSDHMQGVYNAVAPELVTNKEFSKQLAHSLHRPFFMPNVPKVLLSLVLGESAIAVTEGLQVSSQKIRESGFEFEYGHLYKALNALAH